MKRLAILGISGALWLILAAIPALADGGPHVMTANNGAGGINADSCASCHRAHTAQSNAGSHGGVLLIAPVATITAFCRSCHGATGTGASTNVDQGVQYSLSGIARGGTEIGALRGGGFVQARIASSNAFRLVSNTGNTSLAKIPVLAAGQAVTSSHINIAGDGGNGLTAENVVWGNGALGTAGAGPTLAAAMECTACHNPHGNGNYRILNGIPVLGTTSAGTFTASGYPSCTQGTGQLPCTPLTGVTAAAQVNVTDAPYDPARTRNYTVIQTNGTLGTTASFWLYADQVTSFGATAGDYFHKTVPFNANTALAYNFDGPNGRPNTSAASATSLSSSDITGFNQQMSAWCSTCHTRYYTQGGSRALSSGDSIFTYRHTSAGSTRVCLTCHVSHGTNAVMNQDTSLGTTFSANVPLPDGSVKVGDSRLLKVDGRGTCELCHDPTNGSAATAAGVSPLAQQGGVAPVISGGVQSVPAVPSVP